MDQETKDKKRRQIVVLRVAWLIFLIICAVFTLVMITMMKIKEKGKEFDERTLTQASWFKAGDLSEKIQDNYYEYLHMSYIMIGKYPDCTFIKISANVPRNDYDVENYYIEDGSSLMNYYINGEKQARVAIDVSSYQKSIDWNTVKSAGVDVAIIRLGYRGYESGKLALDDKFTSHIKGANAAGMETGVYFFTEAVSYEEGVEEANFVLENLQGYHVTQPIIIDTEYIYDVEARANDIDNTARTDAIVGFCETIQNAGYTPMIYASRNWFAQNLEVDRLADYEWWLAHYANQPDFPYHYSGWQYSSEGKLPGISSENVDLNVWFR